MKVEKNKIFIILTIFVVCILFTSLVYASTTFNPNDYKPSSTTSVTNASKLETVGNKIIGAVQIGGSAISVIALIVLGIKYMMGSVEEKAEYKQTLKPYLIGAILLFGITNLLAIIQNVVSNM